MRSIHRIDPVRTAASVRRVALIGIAAALVAAGCARPAPRAEEAAAPSARPNVLFILADDHAAPAIGAYGGGMIATPNLDRLAAEGMRFANCFCTNAICAPSRAVILTGMHSHRNGVINNAVAFDGALPTFPKVLGEAGYQTAVIGKWHLKSDPTGFDFWSILPGQGEYYNPDFLEMGVRTRRGGYVTDLITDSALTWLEARDRERPFCLLVQHKAPHRNWMPGPEQLSLLEGSEVSEPGNLFDDYAGRGRAAHEQEMTIARHMFPDYDLKLPPGSLGVEGGTRMWEAVVGRMNEAQRRAWDTVYEPRNRSFFEGDPQGDELVRRKYQRYMHDYLRCVASVDANVGRLLAYLDREGLASNTIVVYSSDQGFFLGEHGWFDKRFMYEEALRMPLLVRYPAEVPAGEVSDALVQNLDFAPTFLDYAGCAIPSGMQGRSLRAILRGEMPDAWRRAVYYHYFEYPGVHAVRRHYGVRTDRYKLIRFYGDDLDEWELYDLEEDPHEMRSVFDDRAYAAVRAALETELAELRKLYADTLGPPIER